jgi:hypothetical protein
VNYKNAQQKKRDDISVRTSEILRPAKRKSGRQKTSVKSRKLGGSVKSLYCDSDGNGFPDILLRRWRSPAVDKYYACNPVAGTTPGGPAFSWEPSLIASNIEGSYSTQGTDGDIDYNGSLSGFRFTDIGGNGITTAPSTPDFWRLDYGTGSSWNLRGAPVLDQDAPGDPHYLHFNPTNVLGQDVQGNNILGSGASRPRNQALPATGTLLMVISSDILEQDHQIICLGNRTDKNHPQLRVDISGSSLRGSMFVAEHYLTNITDTYLGGLIIGGPVVPNNIGGPLPLTLITLSYSYTDGTLNFSVNGGSQSYTSNDLTPAGPAFTPGVTSTAFVDDWIGGNKPSNRFIDGNVESAPLVFSDVKMHELAFLDVDDVETVQQYECYLAHKWGFTQNLPASHPCPAAPVVAGAWSTLNTNWSALNGRTWST